MVARETSALLAASTHGRSIRLPLLAYTAATAWPNRCPCLVPAQPVPSASSREATRNCDRHGTPPADAVSRLRLGTAYSPAAPPPRRADGCRGSVSRQRRY